MSATSKQCSEEKRTLSRMLWHRESSGVSVQVLFEMLKGTTRRNARLIKLEEIRKENLLHRKLTKDGSELLARYGIFRRTK